jgi:hypothetical protein
MGEKGFDPASCSYPKNQSLVNEIPYETATGTFY